MHQPVTRSPRMRTSRTWDLHLNVRQLCILREITRGVVSTETSMQRKWDTWVTRQKPGLRVRLLSDTHCPPSLARTHMPVPGEASFVSVRKNRAPKPAPPPTTVGRSNDLPSNVREGLAKARDAHLQAVTLQRNRFLHRKIPRHISHQCAGALLQWRKCTQPSCLHAIMLRAAQERGRPNFGRNKIHSLQSFVSRQ